MPWQCGLIAKILTYTIKKLLLGDQLSAIFVELPEQFRTPQASQTEEEQKILIAEEVVLIACGQINVDQFEDDLLLFRNCIKSNFTSFLDIIIMWTLAIDMVLS